MESNQYTLRDFFMRIIAYLVWVVAVVSTHAPPDGTRTTTPVASSGARPVWLRLLIPPHSQEPEATSTSTPPRARPVWWSLVDSPHPSHANTSTPTPPVRGSRLGRPVLQRLLIPTYTPREPHGTRGRPVWCSLLSGPYHRTTDTETSARRAQSRRQVFDNKGNKSIPEVANSDSVSTKSP